MSGNNNQNMSIKLLGKIIIRGKLVAKTGLHIGASQQSLEIGGVDNPVVRDPVTNRPYIPGSSLKGKMRSLLEIALNKPLREVKENPPKIRIHVCNDDKCEVCRIFGRSADEGKSENINYLTRLTVRDAHLTKESVDILTNIETGFFMSEIKWENQIDRLTSAANPRQTERVPAGASFEFEMIYDIYDEIDFEYIKYLIEAMKLLEDSYLGGHGTRGYGKVEFSDISITVKSNKFYSGETSELKKLKAKDVKDLENMLLNTEKENVKQYIFGA